MRNPNSRAVDVMLDDESVIESQLSQVQAYVREGSRLIDQQIRLIKTLQGRCASTFDADHTLDVMIMVQAGHVAYSNHLKSEHTRLRATPSPAPRLKES
jgi:hypothetical protein